MLSRQVTLHIALYIMAEVMRLLRLSAPVICQFVLDKSIQVLAIVMVGHLGAEQLAATSLGASLANVTGNSFLTALASGLSTLCGQVKCRLSHKSRRHWHNAHNSCSTGIWSWQL